MTANRRITGRIGGLLGAILASLVAAAVYLFAPATGAQTPTTTKQNLVAYFVRWHVIARGSGGTQSSNKNGFIVESWTTKSEMKGTAITRFVDRGQGILSYWDTRFLAVKARKDLDFWREEHEYYGDCFTHGWSALTDPDSYTGYDNHGNKRPSVFDTTKRQNGAVTDFLSPFDNLGGMEFNEHHVLEAYGSNNCNYVKSFDMPHGFPDIGHLSNLPADDPNDPTSFHVYKHFSTDGSGATTGKPIEVEWTADAYLMGKCAERDGPIQEDDPIIKHEEVNLDPEQATVNATPPVGGEDQGVAKLTVRVTCERVPIQNAELRVKVEAVDQSGGHDHSDDDRPRGKIDGVKVPKDGLTLKAKTDADGKIKFKYAAPLTGSVDPAGYGTYNIGIGGIYKVTAKSIHFPEASSEPAAIESKVDGLKDGSGSTAYDLIGQTKVHKVNSYFSPGTLDAFGQLAADFSQTEQDHEQQLQQCKKPPAPPPAPWFAPPVKVSLNDIALPSGGIFDLDSDWQPSHSTHNKGEGGDFNRFDWITGTGKDCDATCACTASVNKRAWLLHTLLELGESKGKWDCTDLGNPPGCAQGEPPTSVGYITAHPQYPHRLHLHVEDATP